jgi:phosphoglycolate phosphatase
LSNSRVLLADLDGTLVHTLPDLQEVANGLLAELGANPLTSEEIGAMVGDGALRLLERALVARNIVTRDIQPLLARFLANYEARPALLSRPYPGVPEVLRRLVDEGWRCAVVTNKPFRATQLLLRALDLDGLFAVVIGGDSLPVRKPDPGPVLAALAELGATRDQAVSVGDHANDLRAAAAAGVPAIFARYGYGVQPSEVVVAAVIDAFTELPPRLAALRPA